MALTIGGCLTEARGVLNDTVTTDGVSMRYSDADLMTYFNDALLQARAKRPDVFLGMGLRTPVPQYIMPDDATTGFPLDQVFYPLFVYYVVGMAELGEDTFSDDSRAVTMLNKFVSGLLQVSS